MGPSGPLHLVRVQLLHAPPHLSRRPQVAAAGERELEGAHRALAPVAGAQGARFDGEGNMQSLFHQRQLESYHRALVPPHSIASGFQPAASLKPFAHENGVKLILQTSSAGAAFQPT